MSPIYEFQCCKCQEISTDLCHVGTTANRCPNCGDFAALVISLPAPPVIRSGVSVAQGTSRGFPAPSSQPQAGSSDDMSVRVYDFEFGQYERDNLDRMVDKERQSAVSDGYSI